MVSKTGTLNTKSVTASQLAQDSPVLPHKMNNAGYHSNTSSQPPSLPGVKIPPAVPPRTRDNSGTRDSAVTRAQLQTLTSLTNGMATIKRNSLGRADGQQLLEEVFRASTLSRRGGGAAGGADGRVPFRREASVPRAGVSNWSDPQQTGNGSAANWSDSLPRRDLFLNQTNSLPRRDKAGLGRPEPGKQSTVPHSQDSAPPDKNKRDLSLERSNPFRDAILGGRSLSPHSIENSLQSFPWYWLIRLKVLACNKTMRCINSWHFSI